MRTPLIAPFDPDHPEEPRMLFLYRPRQSYMPFSVPRNRSDAGRLQPAATGEVRLVPAGSPGAAGRRGPVPAGQLRQLEELHRAGVLTDAEFAAARARLTGR